MACEIVEHVGRGKTYTFQLREGVHFTDGTTFDAQSVKTNFDFIFENVATTASSAALLVHLDHVDVVSPHEVLSAILELVGGVGLAMTRGASHVVLLSVIGFFRAIPLLMLIFWTLFLLPILLHINVPGLATVVAALALIEGAYLSHSMSAGIEAVGNGQAQAILSLGLTRWQALRYVQLPQAVRVMAPSFINQWVSLIKDTSLAYDVGVPELAYLANQVISRLMVYPVSIFLFVGLVYLAICTSVDWVASRFLQGKKIISRRSNPAGGTHHKNDSQGWIAGKIWIGKHQ